MSQFLSVVRSNGFFRCLPVAVLGLLLLEAAPALSQVMVANDDSFPVQLNQQLIVEAPGILDNGLFDDESAPEILDREK